MDDDYIDDDGTIWIWKVLARPSYPANDPRHLSPEMRHRLVEHRLVQMEREAARNIEALRRAAARGSALKRWGGEGKAQTDPATRSHSGSGSSGMLNTR